MRELEEEAIEVCEKYLSERKNNGGGLMMKHLSKGLTLIECYHHHSGICLGKVSVGIRTISANSWADPDFENHILGYFRENIKKRIIH